MFFDLEALLQANVDLQFLEEPYTKEEIDSVVKQIPSDMPPCPDGFNADFLRSVTISFLLRLTSAAYP